MLGIMTTITMPKPDRRAGEKGGNSKFKAPRAFTHSTVDRPFSNPMIQTRLTPASAASWFWLKPPMLPPGADQGRRSTRGLELHGVCLTVSAFAYIATNENERLQLRLGVTESMTG
jgi:hypothetical protein